MSEKSEKLRRKLARTETVAVPAGATCPIPGCKGKPEHWDLAVQAHFDGPCTAHLGGFMKSPEYALAAKFFGAQIQGYLERTASPRSSGLVGLDGRPLA